MLIFLLASLPLQAAAELLVTTNYTLSIDGQGLSYGPTLIPPFSGVFFTLEFSECSANIDIVATGMEKDDRIEVTDYTGKMMVYAPTLGKNATTTFHSRVDPTIVYILLDAEKDSEMNVTMRAERSCQGSHENEKEGNGGGNGGKQPKFGKEFTFISSISCLLAVYLFK